MYASFHQPAADRFGRVTSSEEPAWERTLSLVGRIVAQAARAENLLGNLASIGEPGVNITFRGFEADWRPYGSSGSQLIQTLQPLCKRSLAVKNVTDRYSAWLAIRNQIVHGIWLHEDHASGAFELRKPVRGFQKNRASGGVSQMAVSIRMDHALLTEIYYAFYGLSEDAVRIFVHAALGLPINEAPFPDYTSEECWWPPENLSSGSDISEA